MASRGSFSPSIFFIGSTFIIIPTLFLIYGIAMHYGHEQPFPHCWISKVAQHYPEYVFFRLATISGAVLLILGWISNYFYLLSVAQEKAYKLPLFQSEICTILGITGSLFLMGSTANIDTGKMNTKWHTLCASRFFLLTVIAQIYNTIICTIVQTNTRGLSEGNLVFKYGLIGLILLQLMVSVVKGFWDDFEGLDPNSKAQFLEWTLTITVIMGFFSMGLDCKKWKFIY